MKKSVLGFLILSLPSLAFGQFNESIGTFKDQVGHSVQRTRVDPGFIAAGQDGLTVFGEKEASIVKTKPDGTPQWAMVYGGVGNETFNSIREIYDHDAVAFDGYAALGTTASFASTEDLYFVRTDLSGNPLFSFTFGRREGDERGHCLQYIKDYATGKLGYIMAGQADSYTYFGDSTDILIVKTDESGALTGAKVIGGYGADIAYWVEQTSDGEFVVTGSTTSTPDGSKDIFVMLLDKNLNIVWQTIFINREVFAEDVGYGVVENPLDGTFTVTGFTTSFGLNYSQDAFLINLKPDGSLNWMRTYGTIQPEQGASIDISSGGKEYVVAGFSISKTRDKDAWVFKTDMAGNPIWSNLYGVPSNSTELAAEITNDGREGYVFTGMAESTFFTNNRDYYLVNLDFNGKTGSCENEFTRDWKRHKPSTYKNFQAVDVKDIRIACTQYEKADYRARKCAEQILRSELTPQTVPTEVMSISPNPTSTSIKVLFQDVTNTEAGGTVAVFDRHGRIVYKGAVTSNEMQIPVEGLPADIYVVRFTTRDGKQHQKKFVKK